MELSNQRLAYEKGKKEGLGISALTDEGSKRLREAERKYKREHKIHWNKDVLDEEWYKKLKDELFAPELEGVTWTFARIHIHRNRR